MFFFETVRFSVSVTTSTISASVLLLLYFSRMSKSTKGNRTVWRFSLEYHYFLLFYGEVCVGCVASYKVTGNSHNFGRGKNSDKEKKKITNLAREKKARSKNNPKCHNFGLEKKKSILNWKKVIEKVPILAMWLCEWT